MSDFDKLLEEELEKQKKKKKQQQTVTPSRTLGNSLSYLPSYTSPNSGIASKLTSYDIEDIAPIIPSTVRQKKEQIINWSNSSKTTEKKWHESGLLCKYLLFLKSTRDRTQLQSYLFYW